MEYSPLFLDFYEDYGDGMDKETFATYVAAHMPEFQDARDMYEPINVRVKMAGGHDHINGAAEFSVAYTDNKWHQKLCRAVAKTMKLPDTTISSMELRDIEGSVAKNMDVHELASAGELQVFIRNKPRRVASQQVPVVPTEYSTNKQGDLALWFDSISDGLTTDVSQTLSKSKNWEQLKQMLKPNGQVQKEIQNYLEHHPVSGYSWPEFVRVYSMDDVARNDTQGSALVSSKIASHLLGGIRTMVKASNDEITHHFNQLRSTTDEKDDEEFWNTGEAVTAPLYGKKSPQHMFYDIVEDGFSPSHIGRKIILLLYRRHKPQIQSTKSKLVQKKSLYTHHIKQQKSTTEPTVYHAHPYYSYLHNYYYPTNERHSAHYMANHGRMNMKPNAKYPGNTRRVMEKFAMFTGKPRLPKTESKISKLAPIQSEMPELVPIQSEIPELIPISSIIGDSKPASSYGDDDLVPISQIAPFNTTTSAPRIKPRSRPIVSFVDTQCEDHFLDDDYDEVDIPNIMAFVK